MDNVPRPPHFFGVSLPPAVVIALPRSGVGRWWLLAAFAITLAWGLIYVGFARRALCDEPGHMGVIYHFAEHKPGWPDNLTTPPGYHLAVVLVSGGHPNDRWARGVTVFTALLGLAVFAGAWRKFHGRDPGPATLLFALLPILQPYTAMAYSDVPALTLLLAAWWAQISGRRLGAAGLLAVAALVRQTNLIWGVAFIARDAWLIFGPPGERDPDASAATTFWRRSRALFLVLGLAAGVIVSAGRLTPGTQNGNELKPNLATLHFAGVLVLALGLPLWLSYARAGLRGWSSAFRQYPKRTAVCTAVALGLAAGLACTFSNPHPWNRELWSDQADPFTLLRNWPLVAIDTHPALRAASGLNLVVMGSAMAAIFFRQRHRLELWLAVIFGAVLLGTNSLVEPRYLITPAVFVLFALELSPRDTRLLAGWFALLCGALAPFVVYGRALW